MCGIVGYSNKSSKIQLDLAVRSIAHRGPDGRGIFYSDDNTCGLAHARLAILDVSNAGTQPMVSSSGKSVVSFNGEIYNFRELRQTLKSEGINFKTETDTEVFLEGLDRHGLSFLNELNGMFAFGLFNKDTGTLTVGRDRSGIKPLYYAFTESGFVFGSEIRSIKALHKQNLGVNNLALASHLTYLFNPHEETIIKGIHKLEPGSFFEVKKGKAFGKARWHPGPAQNLRPQKNIKISKDLVVKSLRAAVHRQLVSDVPIGSFLSGGLDSSSICAFAKEKKPDLTCFTIETKNLEQEGFADDLPFARQVAKFLDVDLEVITVEPNQMCKDFEDMVCTLEEPTADPASLNLKYISKYARKTGIKVLLSGTGGDDVFTGYRRHRIAALRTYVDMLPRNLRRPLSKLRLSFEHSPLSRRINKIFRVVGDDGDLFLDNLFHWSDPNLVMGLLNPDVAADITACEIRKPILDTIRKCPSDYSDLQKVLEVEKDHFLANHNLIYTDKMSMNCGVEVRVPFLDSEFLDVIDGIDMSLKLKNFQPKWILKKSMENFLPKEVIYRPKTGFGVPVRRWITFDLKELVLDYLSETSLKKNGIHSAKGVGEILDAHYSGKRDYSYLILGVMCNEIWLSQHCS